MLLMKDPEVSGEEEVIEECQAPFPMYMFLHTHAWVCNLKLFTSGQALQTA